MVPIKGNPGREKLDAIQSENIAIWNELGLNFDLFQKLYQCNRKSQNDPDESIREKSRLLFDILTEQMSLLLLDKVKRTFQPNQFNDFEDYF